MKPESHNVRYVKERVRHALCVMSPQCERGEWTACRVWAYTCVATPRNTRDVQALEIRWTPGVRVGRRVYRVTQPIQC